MPLTIVTTKDERLISQPVEDALRRAVDACGRATLLVPSFRVQLEACRELAGRGLSLGVTVTTPAAWVRERWEVWGDGSHVVEPVARTVQLQALLSRAAGQEGSRLSYNQGTVNVLARIARDALPWLPTTAEGDLDRAAALACGLTEAEADVLALAVRYGSSLAACSLTEESTAAEQVVGRIEGSGADGALWPTVACGFGSLTRPYRRLLASLAARTEVSLVCRRANGPADQAALDSAELVAAECEAAGEAVARVVADGPAPSGENGRNAELASLLREVFVYASDGIVPTGAVSRLLPAGPAAEAEALAQEVGRLAEGGCHTVVVSVQDSRRAWRELAPKLVQRGLSPRAEIVVKVDQTEAGRAYLEFARSVAELSRLAADWPEAELTEEGTLVRLGDMSWWPPRELSDFLLSDIARVPASRAYKLDHDWRGNRLLTPQSVLDMLQNPAGTSPYVAAATRELLKGRLGSAASKLLAPYVTGAEGEDVVPGELPRSQVADVVTDDEGSVAVQVPRAADALSDALSMGALAGVLSVAGTFKELGLTADPKAEGALPLTELVRRAQEALSQVSVVVRPEVTAPGERGRVLVLPAARASELAPLSADAVILCGQTAAESPIPRADDVASDMLRRLGVEPEPDAMAGERAATWARIAVARRHVTLERTLFDRDSKPSYPSVMATEVLACYGAAAREVPVHELPETCAAANLEPAGEAPEPVLAETPAPAGRVTGAARSLVNVPPEGKPDLLDGRPVLSASQIETYLECPYKWFSLRRLRLRDSDAGYGAVEMGTFAHRVLEVTHRTLLEEALEAMAERGEEAPDPEADPAVRIPGSRVSEDDQALLDHAHRILEGELDLEQERQFLRSHRRDQSQAFVPHTAEDLGLLHTLGRDLSSLVDFEAGLFLGYEPRLMEWDFGHHGDQVEYAGAWLNGTVDRMDVDAHGNAIVIDYKHKSSTGFSAAYAAFPKGGAQDGEGAFVVPRRVQSLIYGQVIRRRYPNLKVRGAVYLSTRGRTHALSGAVDADQVERAFGSHMPRRGGEDLVSVGRDLSFGMEGETGMDALLDATEEAVRAAVERMLSGNIEAAPRDAEACDWCPVMNCERRIKR